MIETVKDTDKAYATSDARRIISGALMISTNPDAQLLLAKALLLAVSPKVTIEKKGVKKSIKSKKK